jgi:hypothetical protein
LAYNPNSRQQKFVNVFEPAESTAFIKLAFTNCPAMTEVTISGSVAVEVIPIEQESQEELLNFPKPLIRGVIHEQQTKTVGITTAGVEAVFSLAFDARLATNEKWGVFGQ